MNEADRAAQEWLDNAGFECIWCSELVRFADAVHYTNGDVAHETCDYDMNKHRDNMKKKLVLFGGTGGLGSQLAPLLQKKYEVTALGSSTIDLRRGCNVRWILQGGQDPSDSADIVINLSGYNFDTFLHKLKVEDDADKIDTLLDVNIKGNLNILAGCLPHMREQGYGRVILVSSVLAQKTVPGTALYSASKCFIDSLVRTASAENIGKGVTCNSLQLGYFDGGMCHRLPEKFATQIKDSIGLKRWGSIEELYQAIDFIIENEYITGQNINISGGLV